MLLCVQALEEEGRKETDYALYCQRVEMEKAVEQDKAVILEEVRPRPLLTGYCRLPAERWMWCLGLVRAGAEAEGREGRGAAAAEPTVGTAGQPEEQPARRQLTWHGVLLPLAVSCRCREEVEACERAHGEEKRRLLGSHAKKIREKTAIWEVRQM